MYSKKELVDLKKDFWESFSRYTAYHSAKIGEPINWIYYKTGISGLELKFDIEKSVCRVVLEVNSKDPERKMILYNDLLKYQGLINESLPNLMWEQNYYLQEGKYVSRVYQEHFGLSLFNRNDWPDIFKFMAEQMFQLQKNLEDVLEVMRN